MKNTRWLMAVAFLVGLLMPQRHGRRVRLMGHGKWT
jgi:hypothetical protein